MYWEIGIYFGKFSGVQQLLSCVLTGWKEHRVHIAVPHTYITLSPT